MRPLSEPWSRETLTEKQHKSGILISHIALREFLTCNAIQNKHKNCEFPVEHVWNAMRLEHSCIAEFMSDWNSLLTRM